MTSSTIIDDTAYKSCIKQLWSVKFNVRDFFPNEIADWVHFKSKILGVPEPYIAIPIIVATAYLCQHTYISVGGGMHIEPIMVYGLVAGRSGTNKSAAMSSVMSMVGEIKNAYGSDHTFESGTLHGLMKLMIENNDTALGTYDELLTFLDGMDKGANGGFERSRYLSLFNGSPWSNKTKTCGSASMKSPSYSMLNFTQPYTLIQFARQSNKDGFFQRFISACPPEVNVKYDEKKEMFSKETEKIDIRAVLKRIYEHSCERHSTLIVSEEAESIYKGL